MSNDNKVVEVGSPGDALAPLPMWGYSPSLDGTGVGIGQAMNLVTFYALHQSQMYDADINLLKHSLTINDLIPQGNEKAKEVKRHRTTEALSFAHKSRAAWLAALGTLDREMDGFCRSLLSTVASEYTAKIARETPEEVDFCFELNFLRIYIAQLLGCFALDLWNRRVACDVVQ